MNLPKKDEPGAVVNSTIITGARSEILINYSSNANGQLVILYDVKRQNNAGQIQVVNGYFVHFFAPAGISSGPKRVIFILDKSGSMEGPKLGQMKDAMRAVLSELNGNNASSPDVFNIVTFNDKASIWSSEPVLATKEAIHRANTFVRSIAAGGGTNIDAAIGEGILQLGKLSGPESLAKFIVFLTDGQATVGVTDPQAILANVARRNSDTRHSIHCIAFGEDADYDLLKRLSVQNTGVARKIYAESDAAIQLEGFYAEIANPLLSKLRVTYLNESVQPASLVQDDDDVSDVYYEGGEIMVAGVLANPTATVASLCVEVWAMSSEGPVRLTQTFRTLPEVSHGTQSPSDPATVGGFVERTWAYLTIKYNFVTEVSSLLVTMNEKTISPDEKEPSRSDAAGGRSHFGSFSADSGRAFKPIPDSGVPYYPATPASATNVATDVSAQLTAALDGFPTTGDIIQALTPGRVCGDVSLTDAANLNFSRRVHKFFEGINRYASKFITFSSAKAGLDTIPEYDENNAAVSASIGGVRSKVRSYHAGVCGDMPNQCSEKRLSKSGNHWLVNGTEFLDDVLDFIRDFSNDKAYRQLNETRVSLLAKCQTTDFSSFIIKDTGCDYARKDCNEGRRFHCYAFVVGIRALAGRVCAALRSGSGSDAQCHDQQNNIDCRFGACAGSLTIAGLPDNMRPLLSS